MDEQPTAAMLSTKPKAKNSMNNKPKAMRLADELDACPSINYHSHAAELRRLHAENQRLNDALKHEQDRSGRIGTHGPGCHLWGYRHHECLEREYQGAIAALKALVGWEEAEAEHFDAVAPDDWIMEQARAAIAKAGGCQK